MISRREFLGGLTGTMCLAGTGWAREGRRPKIAALTPIYRKYSHSQHIVDRFLEGYGWEGRHHRPEMDVVSLYVQQVRGDDLSRERARRYPQMKIYPTIAEALTLGGEKLGVDGVLLIGEHGTFPNNEIGQKLYPRYEYFQEIIKVYRDSGRTAPIFNDKHLSWNWDWAKEMVETSREMDFGFMAGSSLPVARRLPAKDLPTGAKVKEAIGVWAGGVDGGDIHVIEAMQAIIERRRGGETGVKSVEALKGDRLWKGLESGSWEGGGCDRHLLESAISRSNMISPVRENYGVVLPTVADMRRMAPASYAYRFEYNDGLKATILQLQGRPRSDDPGVVNDCTVAARLDNDDLFSVLVYLPYYAMRNFFNPQVNHIETLFKTGKSPYPVERTLLTTGMTASAVAALHHGKPSETPHLDVQYQPTKESTFWRT